MDVFNVLAEPRRRQVVEILASRGYQNATQISDEFDVTPQAMSQHLKVLREANIIQMERRAQQRVYGFNHDSMTEVQRWTTMVTESWNKRLDRLDRALKDEEATTKGGRAN